MKRIFVVVFITACLMSAFGQEWIAPEDEAPEALFDLDIGDAEVEFFLLGSWAVNLVGGYQYSFRKSDAMPVSRTIPGMTNGYMFNNVPNLTLSVFLMQKYFFKTKVGTEFDFQEFVLGYKGNDDDFIREIAIGNCEIGKIDIPLLHIPEASKNALGVKMKMASDKTEHLFLARSDNFGWVTDTYIGYNRITRNNLPADSYTRGRFFILPDNQVQNLEVYVGDQLGSYTGSDGVTYKKLNLDNAWVSSEQGWIYLNYSEDRPVAVYYTKNSLEIGSAGLGIGALPAEAGGIIDPSGTPQDFNWSVTGIGADDAVDLQTLVNGRTALKIYTPGKLSRFEHFSAYNIMQMLPEDASQNTPSFVQVGQESGIELTYFNIGNTIYTFFPADADFRDISARYPLYDYSSIYPFSPEKSLPMYELSVLSEYTMTSITLQGTIIPGSLSVKVNGQLVYNYTLNGLEVIFNSPISPSDVIELRYQLVNGTTNDSPYITFGFLNDFKLGKKDKFNFSGGLQWVRQDMGYSEEGSQSPGSLTLSAGYEHKDENLTLSVHAGLSLSNPDTAGIYQAAGMNGGDIGLTMSEQRISPASVPAAALGGITPAESNRGNLLFKNYYDTASSGVKVLEPYTEAREADEIFTYADGQPCGPYLAGGGGTIDANLLVCDYELDNASWTGANIHTGSPYLLKSAEHLAVTLLGEGDLSDIDVFIQFGAVSEDSDDDGILDEETSVYSAGYPFNHNSNTLYFGAGLYSGDVLHSEDLNGNDLIDDEISANVITRELTSTGDISNSWQSREIDFNETERQALAYSPAIRLIIVNNSGTARTGRILLGTIYYSGSNIEAAADAPGGTVSVYEQTDTLNELRTAFDGHVFFEGSDNAYTRIDWDNDSTIDVSAQISPVIPDQYRKTGFFIKRNSSGATALTIEASGWSGTRELFSYGFTVPDDTDWHDVCYDFSRNRLSIDGNSATLISSSENMNFSEMDRFELSVSGDSNDSISIDEFYLADPVITVSAGAKQDLVWDIPGLKYYSGSFALIDKVKVSQSTTYIGGNFSPGFYDSEATQELYSSTGFAAVLMGVQTELKANIDYSAEQFDANGSQKFTIPIGNVFAVSDLYSTSGKEKTAFHSLSGKVTVPSVFSVSFTHTASGESTSFSQDWKTELNSNPDWIFTYTLKNLISNSGTDSDQHIDDYFQGFSVVYPLIIPVYPSETNRQFSTSGKFSLNFPQIVFSWLPDLSITHSTSQSGTSLLKGSSAVSIPIKFAVETVRAASFTFQYTRKFELELDSSSARLADDFLLMAEHTGLQEYILTEIPFYEFFISPAIGLHDNESQVKYSPEIKLNYTRHPGSFLLDLFVPSKVDILVLREYIYLGSMQTDSFKIAASASNNALNLFGKTGTHHIFSFYSSDEFLTRITWTGLLDDGVFEHSWALVNQAKLVFSENIMLTIQNSFEKTTDNILNEKALLRFQWQRKLNDSARLPLLGEYKGSKFLVHSEEAVFVLKDMEDEFSWSVIASHSSEFKVLNRLSLAMYLKLGFQNIELSYNDYDDTEYTIAVEGGISGKMTF